MNLLVRLCECSQICVLLSVWWDLIGVKHCGWSLISSNVSVLQSKVHDFLSSFIYFMQILLLMF